MKYSKIFVIVIFLSVNIVLAQNFSEQEISITEHVDGSLILPDSEVESIVIIIPGSGPTDRNGNQNFLKSNVLKKFAEGLATDSIASFRYDKRVIKQLKQGTLQKDISFEDFIKDAIATVDYFKNSNNYKKVFVAGHSQGSLVAMAAVAESNADGFISLAGAGNSIDKVLAKQINLMAPGLSEQTESILSTIKQGKTVDSIPPALNSIFYKDVQPFLSSWMQYSPNEILNTLEVPVLIVGGGKDLQVSVAETELLKLANENAQLLLIANMNHVLTNIEGGRLENSKSYNEPNRPLAEGLITGVVSFVKAQE
ncbi:MAG: alpha/beta hydrolase [bacterium]